MKQLHVLLYLNTSRAHKDGKAPLLLRVTIEKERAHINTGVLLLPKQWNREKQQIKSAHPQCQDLNIILKAQVKSVEQTYYHVQKEQPGAGISELMQRLNGQSAEKEKTLMDLFAFHNAEMQERLQVDVVAATYAKYKTTCDKVQAYLQQECGKKDIALNKLDRTFIQGFYLFLRKVQGNQQNTAVKYVKNLKRVVNVGVMNGWLEQHPFTQFRVGYKNHERIYLTKEELEQFATMQLSSERLKKVQQIFLFQCYTGLAYADMHKLTEGEITRGIDGNKWIITTRRKTGVRSSIPLLPQALAVLEQYSQGQTDALLLPVCSNQKYNQYLQELGGLCGFKKKLTSHVGRKTFATTVALANGVSIETISRMLGHSSTKITHQYAMTTDLKVSEEMKKVANV